MLLSYSGVDTLALSDRSLLSNPPTSSYTKHCLFLELSDLEVKLYKKYCPSTSVGLSEGLLSPPWLEQERMDLYGRLVRLSFKK